LKTITRFISASVDHNIKCTELVSPAHLLPLNVSAGRNLFSLNTNAGKRIRCN